MKKILGICCLGALFLGISGSALALNLYVDTAPNAYGSPDYAAWEENAFAAASTGTFVNMANSVNPDNIGTTNFEIEDEVVYSFGDLGKRLTFTYWLLGETVTDLDTNDLFEISMINIWDGYVLDYYEDYAGSTWLEPTAWVDYDSDNDGINDGVVGTAGVAWWGAYNTNTPEELAADLAEWELAAESWIIRVKLRGEITSLTAERAPIPEPGTLFLCGLGMIGVWVLKRKMRTH